MPKKGYKQTKEHKDKCSLARIGTHRSATTRKKQSKAQMGENNPRGFKGKHHTKERVIIMSESRVGNKNPMYGKHPTAETIKKQIEGRNGYPPPMTGKHHSIETKKLYSKQRMGNKFCLGHHPTMETRRKQSESHRGEKCHFWKGGISPENTKIRRGVEHCAWRKSVFIRDNFTCQKCQDNIGGNLIPHHILNFAQYQELRFKLSNGITFCETCHILFHKIYGKLNNSQEQINKFLNLCQQQT